MLRKVLQVMGVLGIGLTTAFAAEQQYSADMVTQVEGQTLSGKVYVSGGKMRYELPEAVTITRLDRQLSYVLMPAEKTYLEQAIDPAAAAKAGLETSGEFERVNLGKESVNGQDTDKFKVTYSESGGKVVVFQWQNSQDFPVKIASEDGKWSVEYSNIKPGAPSEDLFEVPSDYQKFAIPSMPGMNPGAAAESGSMDMEKMIEQAKRQAEEITPD